MRLVSMIEQDGSTRCGLLLGEHVVALDEVAPDLGAPSLRQLLEQDRLREVAGRAALMTPDMGRPMASLHLGPPITDPSKSSLLASITEAMPRNKARNGPPNRMLFGLAPSALCGARDPIALPPDAGAADYEVELVVVIGKRCKHVSTTDAMSVVAGVYGGQRCLRAPLAEKR